MRSGRHSYLYVRSVIRTVMIFVGAALLWGCSSTKHVPAGSYLLEEARVKVDGSNTVNPSELAFYLRQQPNHEVLGFLKLQLATYNMSGSDSTKWYNRWARRMGQPPVIYDSRLTRESADQIQRSLINSGFMDARVEIDTVKNPDTRKAYVTYNVFTGKPHVVATSAQRYDDHNIERIIRENSRVITVNPGDQLDRERLDNERQRITDLLHDRGYYAFQKKYITFTADTAAGSKRVNLNMHLAGVATDSGTVDHKVYRFRKIIFITDFNPQGRTAGEVAGTDTVHYRDISVVYGRDRYLRPQALYGACRIESGELYSATEVNRTYERLARLGILRHINIDLRPVEGEDGRMWLDTYIFLSRNKKQQVSFELEGTNSEGDLGFGAGITYRNRNIGHGSELFQAKLRGSYESLSGDFTDLINNRYMEYAAETSVLFPRFKAPLLSSRFKRRVNAMTEVALSFNYQERPEYTRIIAGTGWKYRWNNRAGTQRYRFDVIDVNYVYLPKSTLDFLNQIAPDNPLLRYSYEDHFIMRMGFNVYRSNHSAATNPRAAATLTDIYTLRANIETAGNILDGLSALLRRPRHEGGYEIFGIRFSQYVKLDADYTRTHRFDSRSSLALHAGAGIGVPYGNSQILPFEKRFYAGGANSVRGWSVRTLGPGSFDSKNSVTSFIHQCGDIRLDLSAEYRARLFWVLEGALFVDAGNIWTIRNYPSQPGGVFRFNRFYEQIAASYGGGIRMDFTYFLLRFDLGIKAFNPARNQEHWPLFHPRWKADTSFHFSVGYPF